MEDNILFLLSISLIPYNVFIVLSGSLSTSIAENIGPLSNVCYAVFALGSSVYPKYCNFGKTMDRVLEDLGGERLLELTCGDEMCGQEQQFRCWSSNIFHVSQKIL